MTAQTSKRLTIVTFMAFGQNGKFAERKIIICKTAYHRKRHVKRSRKAQISALYMYIVAKATYIVTQKRLRSDLAINLCT